MRIAWKVIAIISYSLFFVINIFICGEKVSSSGYLLPCFIKITSCYKIFFSILKIRYIATEHPNVTYKNPKYISGNMTSLRYGRNSPIYYVGINMTTLFWLDNNLTVSLRLLFPNIAWWVMSKIFGTIVSVLWFTYWNTKPSVAGFNFSRVRWLGGELEHLYLRNECYCI